MKKIALSLFAMVAAASMVMGQAETNADWKNRSKVIKNMKLDAAGTKGSTKVSTDDKGRDLETKGGVIVGDSLGPYAFTNMEKQKLLSGEDVVLSGKNGEIKGTKKHEMDLKKHPKTGFHVNSPRQEMIDAHNGVIEGTDLGPYALSDQEVKLIKSNKDIVLDGKTGEIKGFYNNENDFVPFKLRKTGCLKCEKTGLYTNSPKYMLLSKHGLIIGSKEKIPHDKYKKKDQ